MTIAFECRSVGYPCEWALVARSRAEVIDRFREHAQCAHKLSELSPELLRTIESSLPAE